MELVVRLWYINRTAYMKIERQEGVEPGFSWQHTNGICIRSSAIPEIREMSEKIIFIRGSKKKCNKKVVDQRVSLGYYNKMQEALLGFGAIVLGENDPIPGEYVQPTEDAGKSEEKPITKITADEVNLHSKYTLNEKDIEDMINLVDKNTLLNIIREHIYTYHKHRPTISVKTVKKYLATLQIKDLNEYLQRWAQNKFHYYKLFGNKLKIETEIEQEKDKDTITSEFDSLKGLFPMYRPILNCFVNNEIVNNEINTNAGYFGIREGMKLTKFISQYHSKELDVSLSKIYQDKTINRQVCISIDPVDYLMSSINQHNWHSCHHFLEGDFKFGCMGYMLDPSTLVAYSHNGNSYNYGDTYKWKTNSKQWRQLIHMDSKNVGNIVFSRQYPNKSDILAKFVRQTLEQQVCDNLGITNNWRVWHYAFDAGDEDYIRLYYGAYGYSDLEETSEHKIATLTNLQDSKTPFHLDVSVLDIKCINKNISIESTLADYDTIIKMFTDDALSDYLGVSPTGRRGRAR